MLFNILLANVQSEYTAFYAFLLHVYSQFGNVSCRLFKSRLYPPPPPGGGTPSDSENGEAPPAGFRYMKG